jgi:CubicO group peptidase (beta-lactamase class C family)
VILQLVEKEKLRLSDTVGRVLPGVLPAGKRSITVRQLLSHTSGLNDSMNDAVNGLLADAKAYFATIHDPALRKEILRIAARRDPTAPLDPGLWVRISADQPLYFPPGEGIHYSSTNYVLLGWIAEKVTGKPLGTLMRDRIFGPLGLEHTAYVTGPALPEPYAHGYTLRGGANSYAYRRFPADSTRHLRDRRRERGGGDRGGRGALLRRAPVRQAPAAGDARRADAPGVDGHRVDAD